MSLDKRISPIALVILDGFGNRKESIGNAIAHAKMPTLEKLKKQYPLSLLQASGEHVGLLPGYIGNSQVGHLTIGAGRIIKSSLKNIHDAIDQGLFDLQTARGEEQSVSNHAGIQILRDALQAPQDERPLTHNFNRSLLLKRLDELKNSNKRLHLMGLLSDAGVHSHEYHLHALIKLAHQIGIKDIIIHAFLDGRDVAAQSAAAYLQRLENLDLVRIGSLHGRFYAMDRDHNLERTQASYDILTAASSTLITTNGPYTWQEALQASYQNGVTDEFFVPQALSPDIHIKPGDGVIFFNFRPDRARQLTHHFLKDQHLTLAFFITMTRYQQDFCNDILFEQEVINHTLLDEIAAQKPHAKIFVIAETEKYAHVTYFFRGMREEKFAHEIQVMTPSIKTKDYVQHPEMSAQAISDAVITSINKNPADFYLINYANADMVGHSGDFDATVKACEFLDKQLEQLYKTIVLENHGTLFITADHGNAEEKIDAAGNKLTAHTTNPVMFLVINNDTKQIKIPTEAGLAVIAPIILKYLGLTIPNKMIKI